MTQHYSKQLCLPPEGSDERRAATHAFKSPDGMVAQFGERLRTEVGKLMVLPIPPYVLHGIELGGISRQVLQMNRALVLGHKLLNQAATVGFGVIPNHQQLLLDVALETGEKLNYLGTSNTARMQLKVKIPPGDSSHGRKLLPVKRILQHRGLSFRRPGPTTVRSLAQPALIDCTVLIGLEPMIDGPLEICPIRMA